MRLSLLGSTPCSPAPRPFRAWLRAASGSFGVHLADGRFQVWRAVEKLPELATLTLPAATQVALDPREQAIACVEGSRLRLLALSGETLNAVDLPTLFEARGLEFQADAEKVWLFGVAGPVFQAHAFDRALKSAGGWQLELPQGPYPTAIHLSPAADTFVLTTNEDRRDPDAPIHRIGVRADGTVTFDRDDIDHPCAGFIGDGSAVVGIDAFNAVSLFRSTDYQLLAESPWPFGCESRFDALVVGDHLLTECHPTESTDSALRVLALPSFTEQARFDWSARADFGRDDDDASLDLGPAVGADRFLEVKQGAGEAWTLRLWQLVG